MIVFDDRVKAALIEDAVDHLDRGNSVPLLLVCEHASNLVPAPWNDLGLDAGSLDKHIGWDIGAAGVTRHVSAQLGATAILARYSRLFMDCNRDPDSAESAPAASDGIAIPGNAAIDRDDRLLRRDIAFLPLHNRIAKELAGRIALGAPPLLIAIHSFTRAMAGTIRPWDIGILWNECHELADRAMARLQGLSWDGRPMQIGANQPYSAKDCITYTLDHHGFGNGLPNLAIEICNDLIRTPAAQATMAEIVTGMLGALMAERSGSPPSDARCESFGRAVPDADKATTTSVG